MVLKCSGPSEVPMVFTAGDEGGGTDSYRGGGGGGLREGFLEEGVHGWVGFR